MDQCVEDYQTFLNLLGKRLDLMLKIKVNDSRTDGINNVWSNVRGEITLMKSINLMVLSFGKLLYRNDNCLIIFSWNLDDN